VRGLVECCRSYHLTMRIRLCVFVGLCLLGAAVAGAPAASRFASSTPPPRFRPAPGWVIVRHGPSEPDVSPFMVWAITTPEVARLVPIKLFTSLARLSSRGIAIWAATIGRRGGPSRGFTTARLPLELSSFRVEQGWEDQPNGSHIQQRVRFATVQGWHLDVRVYFATEHPNRRLRRAAQAELDRLLLPISR
jgi:hypothetical protein